MRYDIYNLSEALKTLKRVAAKKTTSTEMECVLVEDGKAWATDGIMTVSVALDMAAAEPLLLTPKACDIITSLNDKYADISVKDNAVTIKSARGKYKFAMGDTNAFTMPDSISDGTQARINAETLKTAMRSVAYAASTDNKSTKKEMTGIYFNGNGTNIDLVGCDGVRLAVSHIDCPAKINMVLPMDVAKLIMSLKVDKDTDFDITVNGRLAKFAANEFEIYTLLYTGQYFDYKKIINTRASASALNVDGEELKGSLQRAIACWDSALKVPLEMDMHENTLELKMNTATINFDEAIEAKSELDIRIGVNPKLILEALNNLDGETQILWSGAVNPIFVSDESTTALVLPVRLKN